MATKKTANKLVTRKQSGHRRMGGPFLAAAVFCESLIEDTRGAMTPMRIIDGVEISVEPGAPADVPSDEQPLPIHLQGLIVLRTGDSPGTHVLSLQIELPDGKRGPAKDMEITLTDEPNGGVHVPLRLQILGRASGIHWANVRLDGRLITRMPIKITVVRSVKRESAASQSQPKSKAKPKTKSEH